MLLALEESEDVQAAYDLIDRRNSYELGLPTADTKGLFLLEGKRIPHQWQGHKGRTLVSSNHVQAVVITQEASKLAGARFVVPPLQSAHGAILGQQEILAQAQTHFVHTSEVVEPGYVMPNPTVEEGRNGNYRGARVPATVNPHDVFATLASAGLVKHWTSRPDPSLWEGPVVYDKGLASVRATLLGGRFHAYATSPFRRNPADVVALMRVD